MTFTVVGYDNSAADFKWAVNNSGGITITDYVGESQTVKIPAKIDGKRVITIGEGAFQDNQLTRVTIPNSVTTIEGEAFRNNRLTNVTIPNSITTIGDRAFSENQLTVVTIPNPNPVAIIGNQPIGNGVFWNNQLIRATIGNPVTIIRGWVFMESQLTSIAIPDSVTIIGEAAFENNRLNRVTIGNSAITIGDSAFMNNRLTSIVMPENFDRYPKLGFDGSFDNFYDSNGRKAGTYTRVSADSNRWAYKQ
jgi:hypothetical protein